MADKLIAPRRSEPFVTDDGMLTNRAAEYLEQNTAEVNTVSTDTEIDPSSVNLSVGANALLASEIDTLKVLITSQSGEIFSLKKQINDLTVGNYYGS